MTNNEFKPRCAQAQFPRVGFYIFSVLFLIFILFSSSSASAQADGRPVHPSKEKFYAPDIWKESELFLPSIPEKDAFSKIELSEDRGFSYLVDVASAQLGKDGVVRLALVAVSANGYANITYEGFRCETGEYKIYAISPGYGKSWMKFKKSKWKPVRQSASGLYRTYLSRHYLCPGVPKPYNEASIKKVLRGGQVVMRDLSTNRMAY